MPKFICHKMIGYSHIRQQTICQDATGFSQIGDTLAMVVADGHGSSPFSDIGAQLAVRICLGKLLEFAEIFLDKQYSFANAEQLAKHPLRLQIVRDWKKAIQRISKNNEPAYVDYGTTLLFALSTPHFLLLGQLGDGDILLANEDGTVTKPMPVEELNFGLTTVSICMNTAEHLMHTRLLPPPQKETLLMLSTDGYSDSYIQQEYFEKVATDYLKLIQKEGLTFVNEKVPQFLQTVSQQGSGDDISLGLIYWESEHISTQNHDAPVNTQEISNIELVETHEHTRTNPKTKDNLDNNPETSATILQAEDDITEEIPIFATNKSMENL